MIIEDGPSNVDKSHSPFFWAALVFIFLVSIPIFMGLFTGITTLLTAKSDLAVIAGFALLALTIAGGVMGIIIIFNKISIYAACRTKGE